MVIPHRKYLFFITKPYSFAVLEPIQDFIKNETPGEVRWFTASSANKITPPGNQLFTTAEVMEYLPDAVIVPGNVVPHFWPGLKVQIFHGLGEEKKGHYRITGFFDLYCTPGPYMTEKFERLKRRHKHFMVVQTGWPKLDSLVKKVDQNALKKELVLNPDNPVLLYAPTFSPKYTSAIDLLEVIQKSRERRWQWVVKFHDLMDKTIVRKYEEMDGSGFKVAKTKNIVPLMQASDLLITDTSSVAYEYLLLDRPIITYQAKVRKDKGINLIQADDLPVAIERSLENPEEFSEQRKLYLEQLHPYRDGASSQRVVKSIENILRKGLHKTLKSKPKNFFRKRKIRRLIAQ